MKIEVVKKNGTTHLYKIQRSNGTGEEIELDTKTYLLHDICHYVTESILHYSKGFWGMLAAGYTFQSLFGKENPQTAELRFIEQIVGPVSMVYLGQIQPADYITYTAHLDFSWPDNFIQQAVKQVQDSMNAWEKLKYQEQLVLEWREII